MIAYFSILISAVRRNAQLILAFFLVTGLASSALAQNSAPKLTADDYAQILQLYFEYPLTLDSGDSVGFANLFTEDGAFGDRVVGRKALMSFANRDSRAVRHAPLTPLITPTDNGNGAIGVITNLFIDVSQSPAVITRVTQYTDSLVKTPNGWKFKRRMNGDADLRNEDATRSTDLPN